jgi:SAM-dependent methyltransferase
MPVRRKPRTLAGEILGIGRTLLRVLGGYLVLIVITAGLRFPYKTDPVGQRSVPAPDDYESYYQRIYSPAPPPGAVSVDPGSEDDIYVQIAQAEIEEFHVVETVQQFVRDYGLEKARILDVGSGTGYLQDVVENYVGLDISPTASRYYHKPFIEASAAEMPIPDGSFDALWSIWVLEHVPAPEQALLEMRRVVKDGGLLYLMPAWNCDPWAAQGYLVRPFSHFDWKGKLVKASMYAIEYKPFALAVRQVARAALGLRSLLPGPTRLHYRPLTPNYEQYWVPDSDAINTLDRYETARWFETRGDECLNCEGYFWDQGGALIIRVRK